MFNDLDELEVENLKKEIRELKKRIKFLDALYAAGVDSWEGYEIAQESME